MTLLFLFAFCNAQKWSTTGDPFNKHERKRAKVSRDMKKNLDDSLRKGTSLCSLRAKDSQCCKWASLDCYGCNPVLLELGVACDSQQSADRLSDSESDVGNQRDCFCDDLCVLFDDCCTDHRDTCSESYLTMKGTLIISLWLLTIIIDCKEKVLPALQSHFHKSLKKTVGKTEHYELQCLEGAFKDRPKLVCMFKETQLSSTSIYEMDSLINWVKSNGCRKVPKPKKTTTTTMTTTTTTTTTVSQITSGPCLTHWQPGCEEIVYSYPISQCSLRKSQRV